jgi:ABC transport system ATP-binding/permease protein
VPIHGKVGLEQIAWLTPSRWGFGATASTINLGLLDGGKVTDPIWQHTSHVWTVNIGAMAGLFVLYSLITWWRLVKLGPLKRGAGA